MTALEYDGAAAASAVIMSHALRTKKIMFVEGVNDAFIFDNIFQNSFVPIAAKGMSGVICALEQIKNYNSENKNHIDVIGFIDRDYLHLIDESKILSRPDIITTCYRDIEIDIFHTNGFLKLLKIKASKGKIKPENEVIEYVLDELKPISFLRAFNALKKKQWDFKTIDLIKYVDTTGALDQQRLESNFRQKNHITEQEWTEFYEWMQSMNICLRSITRGHDVACVFGQMLRKGLANRSKDETSAEIIEENLRLALEQKFMEILDWFEKVGQWAKFNLNNEQLLTTNN